MPGPPPTEPDVSASGHPVPSMPGSPGKRGPTAWPWPAAGGTGRRLPGPRQLALTLRIRRRIHRSQAGPAEPGRPAAHRVGTGMEEPADLADALPVIEGHQRVRAPHLGALALRPRMTASSAPRRSGVRVLPDMPSPVFCSDRDFESFDRGRAVSI